MAIAKKLARLGVDVIEEGFHFASHADFDEVQKIADPADIAATSSISFTINHIAAVVLPAALGLLWVINHSAVFFAGAAIAAISLGLAQLIPDKPKKDLVTRRTYSTAP